jgi:hypothetical protein
MPEFDQLDSDCFQAGKHVLLNRWQQSLEAHPLNRLHPQHQ